MGRSEDGPGPVRPSAQVVPPGTQRGHVGAVGVRRWRPPSGARRGPLRETWGAFGGVGASKRPGTEASGASRGPRFAQRRVRYWKTENLKFWEPEEVAECLAECVAAGGRRAALQDFRFSAFHQLRDLSSPPVGLPLLHLALQRLEWVPSSCGAGISLPAAPIQSGPHRFLLNYSCHIRMVSRTRSD
jgi:hypothetical protein